MSFRPLSLESPVPEDVQSIDLHARPIVLEEPIKNLISLFRKMPSNITRLDLSLNFLYKKNTEELILLFGSIPPNLRSLDLSSNQLGHKTTVELIRLLDALPRTLTSLELGSIQLGNKTTQELTSLFRALPPSMTSLILDENKRNIKTTEQLITLFRAIPLSVSSLTLAGLLTGKDILAFRNVLWEIPVNVTSLDLSGNQFGLRNSSEIEFLFTGIPPSVTSLNLSGNQFQHCSETVIKDILKSLPSNISSLNLSGNGLHLKTDEELANISKSLPYVLEIQADDLPAEKLTVLNRYNGWKNIKRIHHELENKLPDALSPIVLSYLTSHSEKDIFHGIKKSPPKSSFNLALALGFLATIMAIAYTYSRTSTMNI